MNKKLKYVIDVIMVILMFTLMGGIATGQNGELLGFSFCVLIAIHLLLNYQWFINQPRILKRNANSLLNLLWILVDWLLIIDYVLYIVSSALGAKYILQIFGKNGSPQWMFVRQMSLFIFLILGGVMLGMHWGMILCSCRKLFHISGGNRNLSKVRSIILKVLVFIMIVGGISASFRRGIAGKFVYNPKDFRGITKSEYDYLGNIYLDYVMIFGIYVAASYYFVKALNFIKRKRLGYDVKKMQDTKNKSA